MSEVHRYQVVKMFSEEGNVISYEPHDRELSALREELATTKGELDSLLGRYSRMWDAHDKCAERLTAAEQRNAVMSKLLQRCIPVCRFKGSHTERQLINEIEEACAKPTESGASE